MRRRTVLGTFASATGVLSAGCLADDERPGAPSDGGDGGADVDPETVFDVSDEPFFRGKEGVASFGPVPHEAFQQSPGLFAFVIETEDDLDWLVGDADLEELSVDETFVRETTFPSEQLLQIDVGVPASGYRCEVAAMKIDGATARFTVDWWRERGGSEAPTFDSLLVRADIETAGVERFEVGEGNDATATARPVSEFR